MDLSQVYNLLELGWKVHPLLPKNKVPILKDWVNKASDEPDTIQKWLGEHTGCNWGVATGARSGIFVVDIDPKNGGDQSWEILIRKNDVPTTISVKTGSGGTHYYFKYPKDFTVPNSAGKLGKGIDIRGNGGQVVIPPSIHPNGTPYEWIITPWDNTISPAPKWILDIIVNSPAGNDEYVPVGEHLEKGSRNENIFHQSLVLARSGALMEVVLQSMRAWCDTTGNADISDTEIQQTVESAFTKAKSDETKKAKYEFGKTDDDNARRIIAEHGNDIIYVTGMGWHTWTGKYWRADPFDASILNIAVQTMRNLKDEAMEEAKQGGDHYKTAIAKMAWANTSLNIGKLHAMIEIASKNDVVRRDATIMDAESGKWLLNFNNGTLDLRTGTLRPHNKLDYITKMIPQKYDADAECPFWEETLHLALDGNEQLIEFMQRALGYSMTGSTSEQCLFIAWGEAGNNGKSTILETAQQLLGNGYAQMSDMKVITSTETDNRVASSLAKLQGARLVSMNEAEEYQRFSESLIKQLTGGDTIEACRKYKEPFEFKPAFKLWIRTNEKPVIRGTSEAIWRRIKLIPFIRPIPAEVRKSRDYVDEQLAKEATGIIAWMVRGCVKWINSGLTAPEEVKSATEDYRTEMDLVGKFMEESTEKAVGKFVYRTALYQSFLTWMKVNGYRYAYSADNFGKRVARRLNQPASQRQKKNGQYIWQDIKQVNEIDMDLVSSLSNN